MNGYSILGGLLMMSGGWMGALWLNQRVEIRHQRLEAILALLRYTRTQVDCFLMTAPELLARCDPALLGACGWEEDSPPASFEELAKRCGQEDIESWSLFQKFAASFGKQYHREQVGECDYYIGLLEDRRATLAKKMPESKRLYFTLCLTGAGVLVILLL